MRVLVAGASGFIGSRLVPALVAQGHRVAAMTRQPDVYRGGGDVVFGDVDRPETLPAAMQGCRAAYYLVHALDHDDFVRRDAAAAEAFGLAAAAAGVTRIIYLGGLGNPADDLSDHLRSRQQVEILLGSGGVPVTTLRAGVVIGHGGLSWDLIRTLVERIPVLVVPTWALTRTQPIAADDVIRYLVGVLGRFGRQSRMFEVGGADRLSYVELLRRLAQLEGRPQLVVPVPVPYPALGTLVAARILPLLTGVDARTVHALLSSMRNEVVVHDEAIRAVVPFDPLDYEQAALRALGERVRARRRV